MGFSKKRKKWFTKKMFMNCMFVSAAILVIVLIFEIAQNVVASNLPPIEKSLNLLIIWALLTGFIWFYGLLSPELMEIVFRMLGFKEENEDKT